MIHRPFLRVIVSLKPHIVSFSVRLHNCTSTCQGLNVKKRFFLWWNLSSQLEFPWILVFYLSVRTNKPDSLTYVLLLRVFFFPVRNTFMLFFVGGVESRTSLCCHGDQWFCALASPVSICRRLLLLRLSSLRSLDSRNCLGLRCWMLFLDRSILTMSDGRLDGTLFKAASTAPGTHKKTIVRREQCYAKKKNEIISLVVFFGEILGNLSDRTGKAISAASVQVFKMSCGLFATLNLSEDDGTARQYVVVSQGEPTLFFSPPRSHWCRQQTIPTYSHVPERILSESPRAMEQVGNVKTCDVFFSPRSPQTSESSSARTSLHNPGSFWGVLPSTRCCQLSLRH